MPISSALGSSALLPAGLGFRNKVINGDMRIAQRGTGAITASSVNQYPVDRWIATSNATNPITFQQVADGPAGFTNSVRATSGGTGSAYSSNHYTFLTQRFEGFNVADLAWGTASAKPIVLSFWVKVSANAMGTHSLVVENSTGAMTYIATYTVSTTNWEYKTIQISGPTSGSFPTDNSTGFQIDFTLGVGSAFEGTAGAWTSGKYATAGSVDLGSLSSATWQITGVQLEQNTQPTPFEQRPYGIELQLCQRYYFRYSMITSGGYHRLPSLMNTYASNAAQGMVWHPVPMRNPNGPTSVEYFGVGLTDNATFDSGFGTVTLNTQNSSPYTSLIGLTSIAGTVTTGTGRNLELSNASSYFGLSAEL